MQTQPKHIVAIASGKGGVGKSTVTMNLAFALQQQGLSVGLLDADIYGPSQRRMLGVSPEITPEQEGEKWLHPLSVGGIKAMSMAFLTDETTAMVWRGPMASGALVQMLEQTLWGELDILLVDMPPGTGDIQLTLAQKAALAGAVIVTTPQDIALIDAKKGIEMFRKVDVPVLGVIENMATHVCTQCGHEEPIFGSGGGEQMAGQYDVDVLASLPLSKIVRETADAGVAMLNEAPEDPASRGFQQAASALWKSLCAAQPTAGPVITMGDD
ncbi:ParA family protein [marine gamma proteobacterium HTCC2080]|jgi:ATP-binding protein involved in chromosome partitioning|nr:ParA family protein [marine gamma proteobacterium HTCC2080]